MSVARRLSSLLLLSGLRLSAAAAAPPPGVCDIFLSGGAPCVAAFSLSRALFAAFDGPLYRVRNSATNATRDVGVVSAGGIADVAAQERFCGAALCVVEAIYDQSPGANHLGREKGFAFLPPPRNSQDAGVNLTAQSRVSLAGHPVYSAVFDSHCDVGSGRSCDGLQAGYSNRTAQGTAVGDEPQTVYALFDGRHYNTGCCFEFGNAEKNETRLSGSMEAASVCIICARRAQVGGGRRRSATAGALRGALLTHSRTRAPIATPRAAHNRSYYGCNDTHAPLPACETGPYVYSDLEHMHEMMPLPGFRPKFLQPVDFRLALVKGEPGRLVLATADAHADSALETIFDGPYPANFTSKKQGGIVLGVGGDNSPWGSGTFYEGCMTRGFSSSEADAAVLANVVAARYARLAPR